MRITRKTAALTALILNYTVNVMTHTKNETSSNQLLEAARSGDAEKVKKMIESDPSIVNERDEAGETPILAALFRGHREALDLLVASGAQLNIFEAMWMRKTDRVKELLKEKPQRINSKDFNGATALHIAVLQRQRELVELLLENKAEVNVSAPGFGNPTPLHSAVARNLFEIVELLIDAGADLNAKQEGGLTPLHETALANREEMAELLIRRGADLNVRDDHGRTALTIALEVKRETMIELLRQHGAKE